MSPFVLFCFAFLFSELFYLVELDFSGLTKVFQKNTLKTEI